MKSVKSRSSLFLVQPLLDSVPVLAFRVCRESRARFSQIILLGVLQEIYLKVFLVKIKNGSDWKVVDSLGFSKLDETLNNPGNQVWVNHLPVALPLDQLKNRGCDRAGEHDSEKVEPGQQTELVNVRNFNFALLELSEDPLAVHKRADPVQLLAAALVLLPLVEVEVEQSLVLQSGKVLEKATYVELQVL